MPEITDEKVRRCIEIYKSYFPGSISETEAVNVLKTVWLSNLRAAIEADRLASVAPVTEQDIQEYQTAYYKKHRDHISAEKAHDAIFSGRLNSKYWQEEVQPYERMLQQRADIINSMPSDQRFAQVVKAIIGEYQRLVAKGGRQMDLDAYTKAYITRAAQWMTAAGQRPWLLLRGGIGTGKTTLAYAVRHALLEVMQRGVTAVDSITLANSFISQDRAVQKDFELACSCRSLLIDDLGAEPAKVMSFGNPVSPMEVLLDARYRDRMKGDPLAIITTNLSEEEIASRYGERIASRLHDVCEVIKYDGAQPDYRHNKPQK